MPVTHKQPQPVMAENTPVMGTVVDDPAGIVPAYASKVHTSHSASFVVQFLLCLWLGADSLS